MFGWDGLSGYHGLLIRKIGNLIPTDSTVLDVGCGLCHLYEAIKNRVKKYVGVDSDKRVVRWARERYPDLHITCRNVYSLEGVRDYDVVAAVGLYSGEPNNPDGVYEMLNHAKEKMLITFFHKKILAPYIYRDTTPQEFIPPFLELISNWRRCNNITHNIDERLTILEIYK